MSILKVENFNTDNSAGNTVDYVYDAFDRQISATEKFGDAVINTILYAYDANGQQTTVTVNGRATALVYDNMGRKTQATLPGNRVVNYEYYLTGEPKKVYGAENYTQTFTWNDFGNKASMSTYRSGNTADTTTWTYNNRNFMTEKTYADGKSVSYTYDADGHLMSRLWARGVTTSYAYDNAGRQTGVTYSDGTPSITLAYDYLNRITAVTDGAGSRTFSYNTDSTLASETIPNIVNNGTLEYAYDNLGRRTGLQLKQNSTAVFSNNYTYDVQSRIATVSDGSNTAAYTRKPGTNLLDTTTITSGGATKLTTTRNYDNLYRLTSISSVSSVPSVVKTYSYTYDTKDRRTQLNMADGTSWVYGYDEQGQIISGIKHDADGKAIPGQSFGYAYDGIGNLTSEQRGVAAMNIAYTANNVNQYLSRTIPGIAPVVGEAEPTAAVKAIRTDVRDPGYADTMIVPARDGKYFSGMFRNIANSTAPVNVTYDVYATKNDNANNQQLINKQSGSYLVAKTPQLFSNDFDGNTTGDGIWTYTWNGENRLIKMEKTGVAKLEFAYDYIGRRTEKKVYSWVNGAWSLTNTEKYVYDGCNIIAIYEGNDQLIKTFLWGNDFFGGLLAEKDNSTSYYPVYDGSGNIKGYIDASGILVAEYEYGPFGQLNSKSGSLADHFDFMFASKFFDKQTNLYDYGLRYYSVDLMRWTSRDPLEENGGKNLYAFVSNNPVNDFDLWGLASYKLGTDDPKIRFDNFGGWGVKPWTFKYLALKILFLGYLPQLSGSLPHASVHMYNYLSNSGRDIQIDPLEMILTSKSGQDWFASELRDAKSFIENSYLRSGEYDITSGSNVTPGNEKEDSWDWHLAVAGYSAWGKGHLIVNGYKTPYNDRRCFELEFEYKVKDWYNFDQGKEVDFPVIGKVKDSFMREFELQGLAKGFFTYGSFKRKITWKSGEKINPKEVLLQKY